MAELILRYEIKRFLGHGASGDVYLADSPHGEVALKFQEFAGSLQEHDYMHTLRHVSGIPKVFDVVDCYVEIGDKSFDSALVMEYINADIEFRLNDLLSYMGDGVPEFHTDVTPDELKGHDWDPRFFDRLIATTREVHREGLLLPNDISIMDKMGWPYLVDWAYQGWGTTQEEDLEKLAAIREWLLD